MHALYPDIIARHVPAMPVSPIQDEAQVHREREPEEEPDVGSFIFESVDPLAAAAAHVGSDEEPADDEAEGNETRDDRLRRHP